MNILTKILETKKEEIILLKRKYSISSYESMEHFNKPTLKLSERLKDHTSISIIAEIKKASPSKGILLEKFNHLEIANVYLQNNVDAISVLTDEKYFMGNIEYLANIAKISTVPLLRKDFNIDEFQLFEAKANGADLILLIAEALSKVKIKDLSQTSSELGLEVLLEIHSSDQIDKIDFDVNKIIGINNRDLKTFNVDLTTTDELKKLLPNDVFIVSESGINKKEDVDYLKQSGVNGILVGEHLMKSVNINNQLVELKSWCRYEN
jgi:indole-3-glycerol phosphate synthase